MTSESGRSIPCTDISENHSTNNSTACSWDDATSTWSSCTAQCDVQSETIDTTTDHHLSEETLTALTWAACRTFNYRPSDPVHYFAHQLLRWRHGTASSQNAAKKCNLGKIGNPDENLY